MKADVKKVPVEQKREDADIADAMVEHPVQLWPAQDEASSIDCVATETAVALVYNGVSHAVMMASHCSSKSSHWDSV